MIADGDERFAIEGDPEDALRGLLGADAKAKALQRLRTALPSELALLGHKDALVEAARRADASWDEIEAALAVPR
jgi:hypothetical protein